MASAKKRRHSEKNGLTQVKRRELQGEAPEQQHGGVLTEEQNSEAAMAPAGTKPNSCRRYGHGRKPGGSNEDAIKRQYEQVVSDACAASSRPFTRAAAAAAGKGVGAQRQVPMPPGLTGFTRGPTGGEQRHKRHKQVSVPVRLGASTLRINGTAGCQVDVLQSMVSSPGSEGDLADGETSALQQRQEVIDNHMKKLELQLEQLAEARQRLLDQHLEASILEKTRGDAVQKPYTAKEQQHPAPAHVMPELSKLRQIVAKQIADAHRAVKTSQPTDSSHQTLSDALQAGDGAAEPHTAAEGVQPGVKRVTRTSVERECDGCRDTQPDFNQPSAAKLNKPHTKTHTSSDVQPAAASSQQHKTPTQPSGPSAQSDPGALLGHEAEFLQMPQKIYSHNIIVEELIGEGTHGDVYKGWWQGEAVAVKTLKIDHDTPERRKALLREGAIYHSIVHPSLLRVYGAVDEDDMCALVMPLMEHGSLHSAFASKVPCLDDDMTIVRIMLQVARVLQWLHDRGLFHMDLKTLNILADLTNPSKPKAMLADLGLAIYSEYDWFKSGKGTGTYLWMAPEHFGLVCGDHPDLVLSSKVDTWAFGCVMWEMLHGCRYAPFQSPADHADVRFPQEGRHLDGCNTPAVPDEWRTRCPLLVAVMESCWQRDPRDRPDFALIVSNLEKILQWMQL